MALRIEKAFGLDMDQMLRMQAWFDICAMRDKSEDIDVQSYQAPRP